MQLRKTLISFLLIFSYSIGFAHNAIPHCDEAHESDSHHTHTHEHEHNHQHHSSGEVSSEHSHIAHNDHYDHGIIDLLICALESSNHDDGDCKTECYIPILDYNSIKTVNSSEFSSDLAINNNFFELSIETANYTTASILNSSKEYLLLYPDRGPPSIV